jgi:hypothetical protein
MKNLSKYSLIFITITMLITNTTYAKSSMLRTASKEPSTNIADTKEMLKAQISLFQEVINKLGPTSPLEAANLWAEGEKSRNGVYQYASASKELKSKLSKTLGKAEDNLWVIGVSSPWVKKYEIIKNTKINNSQYIIKVKYYWATSNKLETPSITTLTIDKQNNNWYVTRAL